jgi:N-acetyl-beta-hexosaminidase
MKKLFILCAVVFACMSSCMQTKKDMVYNQGINIIPKPQSLVQNEGVFTVNKKTAFYVPTEDAKTLAAFFTTKMSASTGYNFAVTDKEGDNTISLLIEGSLPVNDEGYTLDVTSNNVVIKAKTAAGLFYGMQSFLQLLPAEIESPNKINYIAWTAPAVSIKDEPRFSYRGIHLDPCRHFLSVEDVKKHLDVVSLFKLNRMHWHLTEDQGWRIEIKRYPKLTEVGAKRIEGEGHEYGGFYTQEEIKDVVKYAQERFITIIPEIELPGHELAAIAAYPELSCSGEPTTPRIIWGVEDVVMCAGKEEVFEFLENVIAEVVPLFPGEYFHIGGDECPKAYWKNCPLCQKRIREEGLFADKEHTAEERLQSYFVQRIEKVLTKHGKKMIGWDEILEGGLAPSATVMSWRGETGGIAAANMGHDVIMTPAGNGMYFDHYQGDPKVEPMAIGGYTTLEKVYSYNPVPDTLAASGKGKYVIGVQCNNWSEYMYTPAINEYRTYPRLLALAEIAWTKLENKDLKDFFRRVDNAYVRLDGHNINYHIPQPEQPNGSIDFVAFTDEASLEFTTTRPIKVVYTLDGSEPTPESTIYESPIQITETTTLKIRSVLPSGKMSPTRVITVEKQSLAPAKEIENPTPGLEMQVAYGLFFETTKLADISEWQTSVIPTLRDLTRVEKSSNSMRGVKPYAAIATGYVDIPEDGVYYISSNNEEVWINGRLLIDNKGQVKRGYTNDSSVALSKGLQEIKVVFLGHIIGGWPTMWDDGSVRLRKSDADKFTRIAPEMLFHNKTK